MGVFLPVQDGGIEGCALTFFKRPKSQLAVEQPLIGHWDTLPKKCIPRPKTKQQPRRDGRRSTIMIKSKRKLRAGKLAAAV